MDGPEHGTTESQQDISVLEQNECEPERNANEPERIAVMCIGNTLMLDEGVGPRVAEELLSRFSFPEHVDVLDCGTMGMSLLSVMRRYDVILVVDAVDNTGHPPGTVLNFPRSIASYAQTSLSSRYTFYRCARGGRSDRYRLRVLPGCPVLK